MHDLWRSIPWPSQVQRATELSTRWLVSWWQWWRGAWWRRGGRYSLEFSKQSEQCATAAGFLFTNGTHVLAAAASSAAATKMVLSGLGGKVEAARDPTPFHTAWRETLEELFHLNTITCPIPVPPPEFLALMPRELKTGTYIEYVYSFEELLLLLRLLSLTPIVSQSPCYKTFPLTLEQLLFERHAPPDAEIKSLAIVPLEPSLRFDPYFLQSMHSLIRAQP